MSRWAARITSYNVCYTKLLRVLPERKILIYLAEKNDQGRVVYFSSDADSALREWLKRRDLQKDYLFYSPRSEKISYAAARKAFVQILKRAELSHYGYSLHCLRHTFATDMLNAGLRIEVLQQILGHQSIEMTLTDLFDLTVARTGYKNFVDDGTPEGEERWENLQESYNFV